MGNAFFDATGTMSEGFVRQRRNLIIISVFIFFIHFTTIRVDNISIFGISFDVVKQSDDLLIGLYIIWAYFFLRYCQYFYQEGAREFFQPIKNAIRERSEAFVFKYIKKNVNDFRFIELSESYYKRFENKGIYYGETKTGNFELYVPKIIYFKAYTFTLFEVVFLKSHFSDFILPFLLSFITLIFIS